LFRGFELGDGIFDALDGFGEATVFESFAHSAATFYGKKNFYSIFYKI
jgi:hypothetical protein